MSISSSDSGIAAEEIAARFRRAIVVALVVLAGFELSLRALAQYLPEPSVGFSAEAELKLQQMSALSQEGADVVFAGTSMMDDALKPALFSEGDRFGRSAYNAALAAGYPRIMKDWLLQEAVPLLEPEVVVLGLSYHDFNDASQTHRETTARFYAWQRREENWYAKLRQHLNQWLFLYRYRSVLRHPGAVVQGLRNLLSGSPAISPLKIDPRGADLSTQGKDFAVTRTYLDWQRDELTDFVIGGPTLNAIRELVQTLHARDVTVVFVEMPIAREHITTTPRGRFLYRLFESVLQRLGRELEVALIRPRDPFYGHRFFADPVHLNGQGMERFSSWLARKMSAIVPEDQGRATQS